MTTTKLFVGAIDFGTTYSGWAFSSVSDFESDPTKAFLKPWHSGGNLVTEKTPTCVLVRPDGKTLEAFGYDAENKYRELTEEGLHEDYFYFRRFKMLLNKKLGEKLDKSVTIKDEMGKSLPALQVFSMSLKYLFDDMMATISEKLLGHITADDVLLVLTVPAIWTDSGKQFMTLAATQAGISRRNLVIALEPEAASIFCRHITVDTTIDKNSNASISKMSAGTRYMVVDAGGGTIDISVHEVESSQSVKSIQAASGGGWGGILVDKAFEEFLIDLFGRKIYEIFKESETEDWLDLWRNFEIKKQSLKPEQKASVNMKFPLSFLKIFKKITQKDLYAATEMSKYKEDIEIDEDKLKFSSNLFKSFFDDSIQKTIGHVKSLFRNENVRKIKAILMVGGYSESPMLQKAIKSEFPMINVIIPVAAASTILRGALVYGHSPSSISERILQYTYGIGSLQPFREGVDPEIMRYRTEKGDRCKRFSRHVRKGQIVKFNEPQTKRSYTPIQKYQNEMTCEVYATDLNDLEYPKDGIYVGELTIDLENPDERTDRIVEVSLSFSGTEISVTAIDTKTGKEKRAYINFLG